MTEPREPISADEPSANSAPSPADRTEDQDRPPRRHSLLTNILASKKMLFFGGMMILFMVLYAIVNMDNLIKVYDFLNGVLEPLFIGAVIAYLCNPLVKFYEFVVFRKLKSNGWRLSLSLVMTGLTVLVAIGALIALIIPEIARSLSTLADNFDTYVDSLLLMAQNVIDTLTARIPSLEIDVSSKEALEELIIDTFGSMDEALEELAQLVQKYVLNEDSLGTMAGIATTVLNVVKNVVLGIFIAIYILASKDKRVAQLRKFRRAFLSEKQDTFVTDVVQLVDRTFGGYLRGMVIDALAVGVVTFIALSIFQISDYNLLIAAICALTNIIPVFGPFIGAIPSGFIVLITNPSKLIWFIVIIIVIQQIDGNILVPKIQGNNTGISSLAVLVAITIMGSLFGVIGMIIGVPVFAVVIELGKRVVDNQLKRQGAPTETTAYYPSNALVNAEEDVYYEHAHLRYRYEHSKLKVKVDHLTEELAHAGKSKKAKRNGGKLSGKAAPPAAVAKAPELDTPAELSAEPTADTPVEEPEMAPVGAPAGASADAKPPKASNRKKKNNLRKN